MGAVILLIALGILLFLIEFLIIPGVTIAGIGGAILTIGGIYLAYTNFGTGTGTIVLVSTLAANIIIFALSLRSNTWKKAMLTTRIDSSVKDVNLAEKIKAGDRGVAITRLAPMGTVRVNEIVVEARSEAGFVNPRTEIEVLKVSSSQVIVKPVK